MVSLSGVLGMSINIQIIDPIEKIEDRFIRPFIKFYLPSRYPQLLNIDLESPDKDNSKTLPDYYLTQPGILVEVKGVYDRTEREALAGWERKTNALRKELDSRCASSILGHFSIDTDRDLQVPRSPKGVKEIVDQILDAIKNEQPEVMIEGTGKFRIRKISDQGHYVSFGFHSNVTFFDPAETVYQNTKSLIKKANKQLGSFKDGKVNKRILLFVNWYVFSDKFGATFKALCRSYEELMNSLNIDEIWFQFEQRDGTFEHDIVYTRDLLTSFDRGEINTDRTTAHLLGKWSFALTRRGDEYKDKVFVALQRLLATGQPHQLFEDRLDREEMVELGSWLIEQDRSTDAIWLIDRFIDDPDPPKPEHYSGNPEVNYHEHIANGKPSPPISSVLVHLACVVQELAVHDEHIVDALRYTGKLLSHKNLHVKYQAIRSLATIAGRRHCLDGYGKRPFRGNYKKFHDLTFSLVELVRSNPKLIAIAEDLSLVFSWYGDLSTKEVELVLDSLKIVPESAGLFVRFGIYRCRYYQDQPIEFNQERLNKKLRDMIGERDPSYQRLRAGIIYCFERILEEDANEFETLQPCIDLFLEQPLQNDIYHTLVRIIEKWIPNKPDVGIAWCKLMLSEFAKSLEHEEQLGELRGLWIGGMRSIVEAISIHSPVQLLDIMEKLAHLCSAGVFNGSPETLFGAFDLIADKNRREETRVRAQELLDPCTQLRGGTEVKKRKTYHAMPHSNGGWQVKQENAKRALSIHPTKKEAVAEGREIAKKQELGQLKIHKKDGTIEKEHTYRKDPYPPEG